MAKLTLTVYTKGFGSGSSVSGKLTPVAVGAPKSVAGILLKQRGSATGSFTQAMFEANTFGDTGPPVVSRKQPLSLQGPTGEKVWVKGPIRRIGPDARAPVCWMADLESGSEEAANAA